MSSELDDNYAYLKENTTPSANYIYFSKTSQGWVIVIFGTGTLNNWDTVLFDFVSDSVATYYYGLDDIIKDQADNFMEQYKDQKYNTFAQMPPILQFITLTATNYRSKYTGDGANKIIELYRDVRGFYNSGNENIKKIIAHRVKRMFNIIYNQYKLGTTEQEKLDPKVLELFGKYDNILVAEYKRLSNQWGPDGKFNSTETNRKKIIENSLKGNGDENFIKERFGGSLADKYSIKGFKDKIKQFGQDWIDLKVGMQSINVQGGITTKVQIGTVQGDFVYHVDYSGNSVSLLEIEKSKVDSAPQQLKDIIQSDKNTPGENTYPKLGGNIKINMNKYYQVKWQDLKESTIYNDILKFNELKKVQYDLYDINHTWNSEERPSLEELAGENGKLYTDEFIPNSKITIFAKPPSKASEEIFSRIYNPAKVQESWIWDAGFFDRTVFDPKVDDLVLGHYLRFLMAVKADVEYNNELENTLGEYFNWEVQDLSLTLIPILARIRQEMIISDILKKLKDIENPEELTEEQVEDILNQAEKKAEEDLNNIPASDTDEEISQDEIEKRQKLYKQCVLLLNADTIANDYKGFTREKKNKKNSLHKDYYFNGRLWMVHDGNNHNRVINKLVNPKGEQAKPFIDITPDIHAALQPRLRIHKVYEQKDGQGGKIIKTHEIPFESFYPESRAKGLSKVIFDKGAGYGIKEFSWSFDGETPATAQKFIKAKLSLYFQTFNDFIKERTIKINGDEIKFRYLDLFVNTKFCPRSGTNSFSPLHYDPSHYRIRVDVGWEPRDDEMFAKILEKRGTTPQQFNKAINITNKTFYLNLIDHNITINQDGTVAIDADYIAYMQGIMQSNTYNALTTKYARDQQRKYVVKYEELINNKSCTQDQLDELTVSINSLGDKITRSLHEGIIKKLVLNEALYNVEIDGSSIADFRSQDFFTSKPKLKRSAPSTDPNKNKATANAKTEQELSTVISTNFVHDSQYQENKKIYFFFMADLIYFILDSLYEDDGTQIKEAENLKVILSSFSFKNPFDQNDIHLNIGEIPIDIDTFLSWYEDEIIDKEITNMPILSFIKRLLHYLIQDVFLETCINNQEHKRLVFQTTTFLAGSKGGDPMKKVAAGDGSHKINVATKYGTTLPLETGIDSAFPAPTDQIYNYLFIFPHYHSADHDGRGIPATDESNGIYHLYIGADRGLTKKISFSKSDIQYQRESRMMQQGSNGLLQLSSVYRASINMIGNTLFYPGMEVFINPFGFGGLEFGLPQQGPGKIDNPNLSNIMGIGGYYQILKVSSKISPGSFTTDLDAHFVYSGDGAKTMRDGRGSGIVKLDLCEDIQSVEQANEQDASACRTVILNIQNDILGTEPNIETTDEVATEE